MRILHVTTDLDVGGAEIMLQRLLEKTRLPVPAQSIVSLTGVGPIGETLRRLGFRVDALGMRRGLPRPHAVLALGRLIRTLRPDVIQTWMYHSDLLGGVTGRALGRAKIVWGIHSSTLDDPSTRWRTHATVALCARLSRWAPDRIICVSRTSRDLHVAAGYASEKFVVIPNGFDTARFRPDPQARHALRRELGMAPDAVLIGLVARVAAQKDHRNFIMAAKALSTRAPEARFLLSGDGATAENDELMCAIADAGLEDRFVLLGRREDVARVMNALDIATLSSAFGEAFPLAIGEAMACGVPCVVTDLGDCAYLVAETGRVVPPRDANALASAWDELIRLGPDGRRRLGSAARARIEARFDLSRIAAKYEDVYRQVIGDSGALPLVDVKPH